MFKSKAEVFVAALPAEKKVCDQSGKVLLVTDQPQKLTLKGNANAQCTFVFENPEMKKKHLVIGSDLKVLSITVFFSNTL